jgi:hypothetical protein
VPKRRVMYGRLAVFKSTEAGVTQHVGLLDQTSQSRSSAGTCRILRYECIQIIYRIENRLDV